MAHNIQLEKAMPKLKPKPVLNPSKMAKRGQQFALTGDTDHIRPYLMLLLLKKGYQVVEYPAKGIKGLICGDPHIHSKDVKSHKKFIIAAKNQVTTIEMDSLPEALGTDSLIEDI